MDNEKQQFTFTIRQFMSENRTLAKNSFILYFRLLATIVIGLYASRIVLLELGAENFGLYAVVGGIVAMLNFLNTTMISTSNRYIAIEIGKGQRGNLNKIFNTLMVIHIFCAVLLIVIIELVGVWYVKNHLNVDPSKISDALFVLHLSAISAIAATVIVPYQGLITAYEKFNVRALIEILNSLLNLCAVMLLVFHDGNKLRAYAFYVLLVQLLIALMYFFYCRYRYHEIVKWKINHEKEDYKGVSQFFAWQFVYVVGSVGTSQGGALIMNLFFGTVLNAAFAVAAKVNLFIFSFVKNLNQAALPQIMKGYSAGNQDRSLMLIYQLSKFTFFIMLIPAVPIMLSIDTLLVLWLKEVPPYTAAFVLLRIVHGLISCLESGFDGTIDATGRIRETKLFYSILFLSVLPIIYILYRLNFPPYVITVTYIVGEIIFLIFQTGILVKLTKFRLSDYFTKTILPVTRVTLLIMPQYFLRTIFDSGFIALISTSAISFVLTIATIYFVGLNKQERSIIKVNVVKLPLIIRFVKYKKA
jgi:O-antigen/teichoic acid export membrane protein